MWRRRGVSIYPKNGPSAHGTSDISVKVLPMILNCLQVPVGLLLEDSQSGRVRWSAKQLRTIKSLKS